MPTDEDLFTSWGLLTEAVAAVGARLAAGLAAVGPLTLAQFDVLIRLYRDPGGRRPVAALARELGLTVTEAVRVLTHMEIAGLVCSTMAPATGDSTGDRAELVPWSTVTARGRDAVDLALPRHSSDLRTFLLAPIGAGGLAALGAACRTLRDTNRDDNRDDGR